MLRAKKRHEPISEKRKKHGGAEQSLAAISAGRTTRESLALIGDSDIAATLSRVPSTAFGQDADDDRTASYALGTAASDGQRPHVLRPHARGGLWAPSSSRSIKNREPVKKNTPD